MNFELTEQKSDIAFDLDGHGDWACISSGDIYLDDIPFGYYTAAWFPNITRDIKMVVSVVNETSECTLTIGIVCEFGNIDQINPADPSELPWSEDGVLHSGFIKPDEFVNYTKAPIVLEAAKYILNNDENIKIYMTKNA